MTWVPVVKLDTLADGEPQAMAIAEHHIALYRVGEAVFATSDSCPHGNARLSEGWLSGHTIECPLHQALFDIRDGTLIEGPPCVPVRAYPARVREGIVEIQLEA